MFAEVLKDGRWAILPPPRAQHPPEALAVAPDGSWARIGLLPRLSVVKAEGLAPDALEALLTIIRGLRDTLLGLWAAPAPALPGKLEGPRAVNVSLDARRGVLTLRLATGSAVRFPLTAIPDFAELDAQTLANPALTADGEVLAWREEGVYLRVPDLVLAMAGGPLWREWLLCAAVPTWQASAARPEGTEPRPAAADGPRIRSLIGLILHREDILTVEEVAVIVGRQKTVREEGRDMSFGQVAIELGLLTADELRFALRVQERLSHGIDDAKPLGIYLMEAGAVLPSQLLKALDEQASCGDRLGEILVRWKLIRPELLETFLERQAQAERAPRRPPQPQPEPPPEPAPRPRVTMEEQGPLIDVEVSSETRRPAREAAGEDGEGKARSLLGLILEREGYLTQAQMRHIVQEQGKERAAGRSVTFGEMALKQNLLTPEQLRFAINMQKRLAYDPGRDKPLWATMLENGVLKPSQILLAIEDQSRTGRELGEILVDQGFVSEGMLRVFVQMHEQRR